MKNVAMNIYVLVFVWMCIFNSLGYIPRMESVGHMVILCFIIFNLCVKNHIYSLTPKLLGAILRSESTWSCERADLESDPGFSDH